MSGPIARQMMFVFLAGGAGATMRVLLAAAVEQRLGERLPDVGVLLANLVGCVLIGLMTVVLPHGPWRTVVLGGFLGGFTTYSAFALFTVQLAQDARYGVVGAQLALHLVGGVIAVLVGMAIARALGLGA